MTTALEFDEAVSRRIEALYTTADVVAQRAEILRVLEVRPGERVLDVGSEPGLIALAMAPAVGPSGRVLGINNSENMVAMSQARCSGQPWVEFQIADATMLPFPGCDFDAAVSTQVYEYVSDLATALTELYRFLRPGGRALILDTDWDSIVWHTTDRGRMDRVLAAWSEHLIDPHLPRKLSLALERVGFRVLREEVIPLFNPNYDAGTYSYQIIDLIAKYVVGRQGITQSEAEVWAEDFRKPGEEGSYFFSLNRYLFLAVKPD